MTDRKRDPLPEGYQYGDARLSLSGRHAWALRQNAAHERRMQKPWNVIEGDHFTTDRDLGDEA